MPDLLSATLTDKMLRESGLEDRAFPFASPKSEHEPRGVEVAVCQLPISALNKPHNERSMK